MEGMLSLRTAGLHAKRCIPSWSACLGGRRALSSGVIAERQRTKAAAAAPQQQRRAYRLQHFAARASADGASTNGSERQYDYDLFCIGAGSGGVRASRVAAGTYGAKVAVCEMPFNPIASDEAGGAGGTCVLRGCVPKKLFVYCSKFREEFKEAQGFGWHLPGQPTLDWGSFLSAKNKELQRLNGIYKNLLSGAGVEYIEGRGKLVDANTVEVAGKRYTAKNILIATGGRAVVPPFEGSELAVISDYALEVPEVPKAVAVIGSGYIAVEFAGIFNGLGSEVHLVFRKDQPLNGFDEEVRKFAAEQYAQNGINLHSGHVPKRIVKNEDGTLSFTSANKAGEETTIKVDMVLAATGRKPNVHNLGLEAAGVEVNPKNGAIVVNEYSQTTAPSVWAVGDVTERMALTPVALMEAMALTKTIFGGAPTKPDHSFIATAVFSQPEIGTVGYTEEQAIEKFGDVDIYSSAFRPMKNTISGAPGRTLMKLIVDPHTDRLLGCHMVGPDSAEIMQGMGVAVKLGVTKAQLDSVVGIHPSAAEEFVTMRSVSRRVRNKELVKA